MKSFLIERLIKSRTKRTNNNTSFGDVKIGPFGNTGSHTRAPYSQEIVADMRRRRYVVTIWFPDNTKRNYAFLKDCPSHTYFPVTRLLSETVFYEMGLSETVIAQWSDSEGGIYQFFFKRVR